MQKVVVTLSNCVSIDNMEGLSKFVSKSFEQCIKSSDRVQEFLNTMTQQTRLPSKLLYMEAANHAPADLSLNHENHMNESSSCDHDNTSCKNEINAENVVEDSDNNSDTIDIDITDVSDLTRTSECEMSLNNRDVQELQPLSLVKHNNDNNNNKNTNNSRQYSTVEEEQYSSNSNGSHQNETSSPPMVIANMLNDELVINTVIQSKDGSHKVSPVGSGSNCSTKTKNWLVSDSSKENHFERSNLINVDGKKSVKRLSV